ncbi:hypothetical protein [Arcanobacterium hippocoleae]|uniref:hypothetical protein n=1 Tax=Arcanobacterium hippocoleae TaxID=149017 RepID=UPI003340E4F7
MSDLMKLPRNQRIVMPVGEWIMVTTKAWDYDRGAYGYEGHLFRYASDTQDPKAPIIYETSSCNCLDSSFDDASQAGAWMFDMIACHT